MHRWLPYLHKNEMASIPSASVATKDWAVLYIGPTTSEFKNNTVYINKETDSGTTKKMYAYSNRDSSTTYFLYSEDTNRTIGSPVYVRDGDRFIKAGTIKSSGGAAYNNITPDFSDLVYGRASAYDFDATVYSYNWVQLIDTEVKYSTSSKRIGSWIDGDDVFEKTFTGSIVSGETTININAGVIITNLLNVKGFVKCTGGNENGYFRNIETACSDIVALPSSSVISTVAGILSIHSFL